MSSTSTSHPAPQINASYGQGSSCYPPNDSDWFTTRADIDTGSATILQGASLLTAAAELGINDCSSMADFELAFLLQYIPLEQLLNHEAGKAAACDFYDDVSGTFTDSGFMNTIDYLRGPFALPADSFPDLDVRYDLGRVADSAICPEALSTPATVPQCSDVDMTPRLMRYDPDESVGDVQRLDLMSIFGDLQVEMSFSAGISQPSLRRQSQELLGQPFPIGVPAPDLSLFDHSIGDHDGPISMRYVRGPRSYIVPSFTW